MALSTSTHQDVQTTGADTNGGGFNPATAGAGTDLAATSGTTAAPVVTSATYTFVAGDVGHWLFVKSGTNWTPGWYKITSVAAGAATLNATIAQAVLYVNNAANRLSSVVGCATVAAPTGGTWSVDYSQSTVPYSVTDAVTAGTTTITSATGGFRKSMIGNLLYIQGGTAPITAGWYEIITVPLTTSVTVDRSTGLTTGTGATLKVGGPLVSLGAAGLIRATLSAGAARIFLKGGAYTVTSATPNVAGGTFSDTVGGSGASNTFRVEGYTTYRCDKDASGRPTITANGVITAFTLLAISGNFAHADNLALDCNSRATSTGVDHSGLVGGVWRIKVSAGTVRGIKTANSSGFFCEVTGMTAAATAACDTTGSATFAYTKARDNLCHGFLHSGSYAGSWFRCIASSNTGATSDGFSLTGTISGVADSCIAVSNGRHGFNLGTSGSVFCVNCIGENNATFDFGSSGGIIEAAELDNCAVYNVGGTALNVDRTNLVGWISGLVTGTGSFFVNAGTGNFALNNTAGAGAAARAAGLGTFPGGLTVGYPDIGAAQHQDAGGAAGMLYNPGMAGSFVG